MPTGANKMTIRRYVDELNRRNLAGLDELIAEEVVTGDLFPSGQANEIITRAQYKQRIEERLAAFPDYQVTIVDMVAEADRVVLCWTNCWTHQAEVLGVPPTGKVLKGTAVSIYRLDDGKITEVRGYWDRADLWQQLSLIPPTGEIVAPKGAN